MSLSDVALYTHLISLGVSLCGIALADHEAFAWIRGKVETLRKETLLLFHHTVSIGLGLMLGSGGVLFWQSKDYLLHDTPFYIKMSFVIALLINSFVIQKYLIVATQKSFASLTASERLPLYISGSVSTFSWIGAAVTAFFLF